VGEPWAVWGAMVVLGAGIWPWLRPAPEALWGGVVALGLLGVAGARVRTSVGVIPGLGLLLGLLAPALLPDPPPVLESGRIVGTVAAAGGGGIDLDADAGRLRVRMADPPPVGARIAGWVRPERSRDRLPGEPDPALSAARARRTRVRLRQWVRLGPEEPARLDPFRYARHRGLLQALTGAGARVATAEDVALLNRTGTRHLLAVSGLHIGLVAGALAGTARVLLAPLAWLPWVWPVRVLPALVGVGGAWAFASAAGWPTSARRALVMFALGAAAWVIGRRPRPASVLGMVAGGMVLVDPGLPGDLGFRLSFGAVLGLILVAPRVTRLLPPDLPRVVRWAAGSLAATLGATAGTLPDTAWTFQSLAPLVPVANLVALPLLAGVAVPAALGAHVVSGTVGLGLVAVADAACGLAMDTLLLVDREPWTPAVGPLGAAGLALAVGLRRRIAVAGLLLLLMLALRPVPAGRLAVTFLPVGQGDAALVEHPDGRRWLVDGGPPGADVVGWLRRRGVRRLDAVVLSHPHPDHMAGLVPVLRELPVRRVFVSRAPEAGESAFLAFWHTAWATGARVGPPDAGEGGARWLHPAPDFHGRGRSRVNDESLVLELGLGRRRFLLTGDVERAGEEALVPMLHPVDVVKVPHHGSRTSSSVPFVAALAPEWVVLSVGTGNRFRHPHVSTLGRWVGARRVRTDEDGAIRFTTDGDGLHAARWDPWRGWIPLRRRAWRPRSPGRRRGVSDVEDVVQQAGIDQR